MINDENHARLFAPSETMDAAAWRAELRNDELSDITFNGIPVLRAVRAVVRDHDWRTLVPTVSRVAQHARDGGVRLQLGIDFAGFGTSYTGELAVHLMQDSVKVTFDGVAPAAFRSLPQQPDRTRGAAPPRRRRPRGEHRQPRRR
ncbi:hypothetical protein [Arthrobacter ramosus]|uniref:D-apionate lactonase N-terminal domain-containing protein n=1 Tax=Arthrobacter ramosus TaxID=1672 RepID=A0ABV5Y062_ARTRM|nr:hypothetical protein [Arthrobacter ramosus]